MVYLTAEGQSDHETLSVEAFRAIINTSENIVIIDLRTPGEHKDGIIPGARQIDYFNKTFVSQIDALDKNKTYLLYCASGGRSGETLEFMHEKGFKHVYHLKGGFQAWKNKNQPVAQPSGKSSD